MANQYPAANMFNGQYAPPPPSFFPPYHANSPTLTASATPGGTFPATNARRFEANTHVPSPTPLAYPPPKFDPELLKQLAASGTLHFPLPPPPPPPQLFSSSYTPSPHLATTTSNVPQQQFPPFPYARPSFQPSTPTPVDLERSAVHGKPDGFQGPHGQQRSQPSSTQGASHPPIHSLDGIALSRMSQTVTSTADSPKNSVRQSNAGNLTHDDDVHMSIVPEKSSYEELHTQAKAAIIQCVPTGATYDFWLQNGVKQPVVDRLFAELNIEPLAASSQAQNIMSPDTAVNSTSPKVQLASTPQQEKLDPAMERKDRIARLLAAKKGQSLASAKSSQSASPAPFEPLSRPAVPASVQKTEVVSRKKPSTRSDAADEVHVVPRPQDTLKTVQPTDVAIEQSNLSTPVREKILQQDFAIPGLFMTSADPLRDDEPEQIGESVKILGPSTIPAKLVEPISRKHNPDPLPNYIMPPAKRQASQAVNVHEDVEMADTTVSTPTDVSVSSPLNKQVFDTKEIPELSESDKPNEVGQTALRPKVNQNKLKDRMAALKADLLRKSSRKKALQDGMPVLDAEVEKTRERLREQQARLRIVRNDVFLKTAELDETKKEERALLREIQALQDQLADGESGQQQFSTELTQLNNQIDANEQESLVTSQPQLPSSPVDKFITPPVATSIQAFSPLGPETHINGPPSKLAPPQTEHRETEIMPEVVEDQRHSETEYSAEQEDLDRQLNSEVLSTAAQAVENILATSLSQVGPEDESPRLSATPQSLAQAVTDYPVSDAAMQEIDGSDDDRMSIDNVSDVGSSGSASMSDSGSEEYEPTLDQPDARHDPVDDVEDYEPTEGTPYQQSTEPENEEYEPAEEVDVLNVSSLDRMLDGQEAPNKSTPSLSGLDVPESSGILLPSEVASISPLAPVRDASTDHKTPLNQLSDRDHDLTNQQQIPTAEPVAMIVPMSERDKPAVSRFVPYQSPLSKLKSFRFHPQFNELVKNGYRSLTYSNNIDVKKPLCPAELEGDMCTDVECQDQHFGSMALSDDKILVQMSSANDLKDKDQRDAYLLGLKKVIADLRGRGVKEFSEVANALSKYRRDWMQAHNGLLT